LVCEAVFENFCRRALAAKDVRSAAMRRRHEFKSVILFRLEAEGDLAVEKRSVGDYQEWGPEGRWCNIAPDAHTHSIGAGISTTKKPPRSRLARLYKTKKI
jgi:hypothetical protein